MQLFEDLTDERNIEANLNWMDRVQTEQAYKQLQRSGAFAKRARMKTRVVWLAAASVILIAGIFFLYQFTINNKPVDQPIATFDTTMLQPGGDRATLTLSDGSVIDLATVKNGTIQNGEGSHVSKPVDGELVYDQGSLAITRSFFHTLSTPVGGQYQVRLPDGTKVWLNAASTLKYSSQFTNDERRVELNGEAFFEVAKNEKQPFRVMLNDSAVITVLGTHFNVMSYQNENAKEITLVEGRVSVKKDNRTQELIPGMQAKVTDKNISTLNGVDTEEVTGWKKGLFVFHDASIESIMRQVERWYDAKVVYQGQISQQFNASIDRSEPLSKLLHLLDLTGYVKFKIENKTIYVLP
jgi:ferric-dicitrate binding protein FerR (iron transport regulator)